MSDQRARIRLLAEVGDGDLLYLLADEVGRGRYRSGPALRWGHSYRRSMTSMGTSFTREVEGRTFRKASASGAGNDCVYLPTQGPLDAVYDSKSGATLTLPARALVAFARQR